MALFLINMCSAVNRNPFAVDVGRAHENALILHLHKPKTRALENSSREIKIKKIGSPSGALNSR